MNPFYDGVQIFHGVALILWFFIKVGGWIPLLMLALGLLVRFIKGR